MVGDDACSVCASLIQKLLEFIANMERNRQYNRNNHEPKTPKINTGKISKKAFEKLQNSGMNFEYVGVPKNLLPQYEEAVKKMRGTFFSGGMQNENTVYVAVPANQRSLWTLAAQHCVGKKLETDKEAFILQEGKNKLSEEEMQITSDVMNIHDIPMLAFKGDDGKYMTVVPKEFEGQYNKAMADVKNRLKEMNNIDVVRYDQTSPLDAPTHAAYIVTEKEAQELSAIAQENGLDIKFAQTPKGIAVLFEMDIFDEMQAARDEYNAQLETADNFLIDLTDNTISMDINKLVIEELSDDATYFVRVPNTSGKDYIRLDKDDVEVINGGKSLKTELDPEKSYTIYDSTGGIKQKRSGEELAKSYNTRHNHANKDTKIYEHGQGMERVNLYNKQKNEIISIKLDDAEVMKTSLKEHGITGKAAEMLMEDINEKLSDKQKEIFNYTKESIVIEYADIPNIGEYLAQSQLSQAIVGKMNMLGEIPKDDGAKCCVMDKNTDSYAVLPVMPVNEVRAKLTEMGYSEISVKEIADKIVRSYREGDILIPNETKDIPKTEISRFGGNNVELSDCGYCKTNDGIMLIREGDEEYKYMSVANDSPMADVEKALKDNFGIKDDISVAAAMKTLIDENIIASCEPKSIEDVTISRLSSRYIEISHEEKTEMMPIDKLDMKQLVGMGISEKTSSDILKSLDKAVEESKHPNKKSLIQLKETAKNLFEKSKANKDKNIGDIPTKGQVR